MKISIFYYRTKMSIETYLLEEYVNFVDLTKKQNKYFNLIIILFMVLVFLFLILLLFKYLNE